VKVLGRVKNIGIGGHPEIINCRQPETVEKMARADYLVGI
jgi:hypothetical protein